MADEQRGELRERLDRHVRNTRFLMHFLRDRRGVSSVEYALLLIGILLLGAGGYRLLGKNNTQTVAVAEATLRGGGGYAPSGAAGGPYAGGGGPYAGGGGPSSGGGSSNGTGGGGGSDGVVCDGRSCGVPGGACFVAGTMVATPSGQRPIESLRVGDLVLARGERDGEVTARPIATTYVRPGHALVDVHMMTVDGALEKVRSTPEHLYFTQVYGWMPAVDLAAGQTLLDSSGREVQVRKVVPIDQEAPVYNFEVDVDHTYFVGHGEVWVHNPQNCGDGDGTNNPPVYTGPVTGLPQGPPQQAQGPPATNNGFTDHSHDTNFSNLGNDEGQALIDGVHDKLDGKSHSLVTTSITQLQDGRLVLTASGKDGRTTPAQREAARQALRNLGYSDQVIAQKLLIPDERGNPGYIPGNVDNRIYKQPDGTPYPTGHHGEGKGFRAAEYYGVPAVKQWSSSGASHGGAACPGCEGLQQHHGVENPTGTQSGGGRPQNY